MEWKDQQTQGNSFLLPKNMVEFASKAILSKLKNRTLKMPRKVLSDQKELLPFPFFFIKPPYDMELKAKWQLVQIANVC